jgi:hypothetical protein
MSADLHIHIETPNLTEEDFEGFFSCTFGTVYFNPFGRGTLDGYELFSNTPQIHVGEVSWLKAAVTDDPESYIPPFVQKVAELFEMPAKGKRVIITPEIIAKVEEYKSLPNATSYKLSSVDDVIEFLKAHVGKPAFTISW